MDIPLNDQTNQKLVELAAAIEVSNGSPDMTLYVKKSELPDLTPYEKSSNLDTDVGNLGYIKKNSLPDLSPYAKTSDVTQDIENIKSSIPTVDLTPYVKSSDLANDVANAGFAQTSAIPSAASLSGNFIPLSGTTSNNNVTGTIYFSSMGSLNLYSNANVDSIRIVNMTTGLGINVQNNSTGTGISLGNGSTGYGISVTSRNGGTSILTDNIAISNSGFDGNGNVVPFVEVPSGLTSLPSSSPITKMVDRPFNVSGVTFDASNKYGVTFPTAFNSTDPSDQINVQVTILTTGGQNTSFPSGLIVDKDSITNNGFNVYRGGMMTTTGSGNVGTLMLSVRAVGPSN